MNRTVSCELQGSSPTFSAAIPPRAVRIMYSFAFVDTVRAVVHSGSHTRLQLSDARQLQGLSQVNGRATRLSGTLTGDNLSPPEIGRRQVVLGGFRISDFGFRVGLRTGGKVCCQARILKNLRAV